MAFPFFQQGAFTASPNDTPETIAQKRAYIAAMMPRFGSAKFVGEGLGQLATGVAIGRQNRDLNDAESAGRKSAEEQFNRLFGTANSAGSPEVTGPLSVLGMTPSEPAPPPVPVDPSNPEAIASDAMTALGKGATPEGIKAGLVARGMPEHIADGFVMNFQDESGLNPGVNEVAPLVPGSRGGFGLAQWTGPRRKALEAFAAERGMPVSDPGVQMDFLMTELQGPEAAAWAKISGTQNAGEAGAAIVNSFLRPAEEHRRAREAEYLGGGGMPVSGAAPAPTSAPAIPINELYMALQNPWLSTEQKGLITSMIQEQQAASDPMRQLELRKAELELAQLENPTQQPPEDFATRMFTLNALQIDPQSEEGKVYIMTGQLPEPPEPGFTTMTPEEVAQLGLPPGSYQRGPKGEIKQIGGGGQTINVNTGSEVGTIPQGFELFTDPTTGARSMRPIPGGPEDTTKTDEAKASGTATASDIITTAAARALDANSERVLGGLFGALAAYNPGTPNAEVYRQTDVLKANAKVENLQAMRNESPTGGALGSVTEGETKMLADQAGALDPASPNYERDVKDYTRNLLRVIHGKEAGDAIFDQQFGGLTQSSGVPSGIDPADWEYMTPEERALFQ